MKRLAFILFAFLPIALILVPAVYAQDQVEVSRLSAGSVHNGNYFSAHERVEVSGTVNGDVYVAGGVVRVNGEVANDLLAAGGDMTVTGSVGGDIRIAGGTINLSGAKVNGNVTVLGGQVILDKSSSIAGSLVVAGGNVQVFSNVGKGIHIAGGNVEIGGATGGNIEAAVGELSILSGSKIAGRVHYVSDTPANIANDASVSGSVIKSDPPKNTNQEKIRSSIAAGVIGLIFLIKLFDILMLLLVGLLFILVFPNYVNNLTEIAKNKFGTSLLIGLLFVVGIPILAIIFITTIVGIPLAFLTVILYVILLWFSKVIGIYIVMNILFNKGAARRNKYLLYLVGVFVYLIISLTPLSILLDILLLLLGTGIIVMGKRDLYKQLRTKKLL